MSALLCLGFCGKWFEPKDECCICIPLRPGSITIGYSLVVLKSLLLAFTCVLYIMNVEDSQRPENSHINFKFIIAVNIICMIIQITEVLLAIILLVGLHSNNLAIVKVFVVGAPVSFTILGVLFIITIIKDVMSAANNGEWGIFIPEMVFGDSYMYCIIIIKSYYNRLKSPINHNLEQDSLNMEQENNNVGQDSINMEQETRRDIEDETLNTSTESLV